MRTLDRNRPFGTIYPASEAAFEQDGLLFDAHGNPVGGESVAAAVVAGPAPRKPGRPRKEAEVLAVPAPELAVDSQLASQLQDD